MKLFTIGPTEMYETTKKVREKKIPYFRNQDFSNIMFEIDSMLKRCMNVKADSEAIYLTASGTAALEAVVDNIIRKDDKVLVVEGGTFGKRFAEICDRKSIATDSIKLALDEELTWEHFAPYKHNDYAAVLVNLHETSTGQLYDIELFKKFCEGKDTLLIVDAISTFLCDEYDMSGNGIDVTIISSQKGLCVSPGVAVVVMTADVAANKLKSSEEMECLYFDFNDYIVNMKRGQTPYTPAVGIMYEIHDMLKSVTAMGMDIRLGEIEEKASKFRETVICDGISIPEFNCSNAITTVIFDKPIAKEIEKSLIDSVGYVINPCGGDIANYRFRVSHVGAVTTEETIKLAEMIKDFYKKH